MAHSEAQYGRLLYMVRTWHGTAIMWVSSYTWSILVNWSATNKFCVHHSQCTQCNCIDRVYFYCIARQCSPFTGRFTASQHNAVQWIKFATHCSTTNKQTRSFCTHKYIMLKTIQVQVDAFGPNDGMAIAMALRNATLRDVASGKMSSASWKFIQYSNKPRAKWIS